jgi:NADH-quinone oxidoreductase subunit A
VLIFPWALIYSDAVAEFGLGPVLGPMLVFLAILVIGLGWAWRTGAVRWIKSERADIKTQL